MTDIVIRADGTPIRKESTLNLRDGNVLDKLNSRPSSSIDVSKTSSPEVNKSIRVSPSPSIGMADLLKILTDFTVNIQELTNSINKLSAENAEIKSSILTLREEIAEIKVAQKSLNTVKVVECLDNKSLSCGSAKYDRGIIDINIDLKAEGDILLFETSFAKIDTSFTFSLEIDSTTVNGVIIEKDSKYYLSFPKLEKYPINGLQFNLSAL